MPSTEGVDAFCPLLATGAWFVRYEVRPEGDPFLEPKPGAWAELKRLTPANFSLSGTCSPSGSGGRV